MKKRKILVLTGKRGGFGAMKPMLREMRDCDEIELQIVVTDQHVSSQFGNTISEVENEFQVMAAVDMEQDSDTGLSRARAVGRCLQKVSSVLASSKPDICVLYGDRGEVLATAIAATMLNIPIAHIQGGDVSGSLDEQMRHATTKLSHLHFPATESSAERLRRMGEEEWRIHLVGDNHVDLIVAGEFEGPERIARELGLDLKHPILVVLQHSETTRPDQAFDQMEKTLRAVIKTGHQTVIVHPCSDQGYEGILSAISTFAVTPQFRIRVNLEAPIFWGLLNVASLLIGNSSAGLIEAPYFKLPAINIGRRQSGRMHAENVIHADHDVGEIERAINMGLSDPEFRNKIATCAQPFGDGKAGARIFEVLSKLDLHKADLLTKVMTY